MLLLLVDDGTFLRKHLSINLISQGKLHFVINFNAQSGETMRSSYGRCADAACLDLHSQPTRAAF
jgi:hypothetical protein